MSGNSEGGRGGTLPLRARSSIVLALALVAMTMAPALTAASADTVQMSSLEAAVLAAVRDAKFGETIDFGPFEDVCPYASFCTVPAGPVKNMPNVDVAVIELDAAGRPVDAANVLLSRDYPNGLVVPIDRTSPGTAGTYGTGSVRWRRWDIDRYNGGTFDQTTGELITPKGWTDNPSRTAADDIVAGREGQYRARLMVNHKGLDCAYPGVEVLPDGTFVVTTYGHWSEGEEPYVVSVRLKLTELDDLAKRKKGG